MDVLFMSKPSNPFRAEPVKRSFYCPTSPRVVDKDEGKVQLSPTRPLPRPLSPCEHRWDVSAVPTSAKDGQTSSASPTSSKFDESWPSTDGDSPGGGGDKMADDSTLAKYIHRFRNAPPTARADRTRPDGSFWWTRQEDHTHVPRPPELTPVTPPNVPMEQSTPTSSREKPQEEDSALEVTPPTNSLGLQVSSDGDDSLQERAQSVIDKSSSLLTASTASSLPAQKYLNTRQRADLLPSDGGATVRPPSWPLRQLPLDPETDILYQWRLRRRLELARKEASVAAEEGRVYHGGAGGRRGERVGGGGGGGEGEGLPQIAEVHSREQSGIHGDTTLHSLNSHRVSKSRQVPVLPPVRHHPHLCTPSHSVLHPHTHMACDIIPCPCCDTENMAATAHVRLGRRGTATADENRQKRHRNRSKHHDGSSLRSSDRSSVDRKAKAGAREPKGVTNESRSSVPQSPKLPPGSEETMVDSVASSLPEKAAARPKVLVNGSGISPSVEGHLSASGVKVTECEVSEDARPPVRYPSPSVIARLKTERPHPPAAEQETQAVIFVAEHDSSQHSLTEVDLSLTPLRSTHSCAQSTSGDEGPDSQQEPSRGASADISIGPLVSEAVECHLFGSPSCPSPTHKLAPAREALTSKCPWDPSSHSERPLPELDWSEAMGDALLSALIKKAETFEAGLSEIDRLLSGLEDD